MSDPAPLTELDAPGIDKATQTELEAAAFRRLVSHLRERTEMPVFVAEDPLTAVVRGTGQVLEEIEKFDKVLSK